MSFLSSIFHYTDPDDVFIKFNTFKTQFHLLFQQSQKPSKISSFACKQCLFKAINAFMKTTANAPFANSNHPFPINVQTSIRISNRTVALDKGYGNRYQTEKVGESNQQSFKGCNNDSIFTFPFIFPIRLGSANNSISFSLFGSLSHSPTQAQYKGEKKKERKEEEGKRREKEKGKNKNVNINNKKKYWNLITIEHSFSAGTLEITGNGEMTDYTDGNQAPWYSNRASITIVIIKEPITSVGSYSFNSYTKIESVKIANSVLKINQFAFFNCVNLTSLNLSNNLTQIGASAFQSCTSLASLILPNSLSIISDWCFAYCSGLTSLIIPVGVTTLQLGAFYFCDHLESVNISHTVTTIGDSAFDTCSVLTNVTYCGTTDPGSNAYNVFIYTKVEKVRVSTNYGSGNTFCGYPIEIGVPCFINKINSKTFSPTIKSKLSSSLIMKVRRHCGLLIFQ